MENLTLVYKLIVGTGLYLRGVYVYGIYKVYHYFHEWKIDTYM